VPSNNNNNNNLNYAFVNITMTYVSLNSPNIHFEQSDRYSKYKYKKLDNLVLSVA